MILTITVRLRGAPFTDMFTTKSFLSPADTNTKASISIVSKVW
jgi:hypothetical protein